MATQIEPIAKYMYCASVAYTRHEFRLMILSLIKLKNFSFDETEMGKLSPHLIDFLIDTEMWKWIESSPQTNWTAASYIINDLSNILVNNNITNEEPIWDH